MKEFACFSVCSIIITGNAYKNLSGHWRLDHYRVAILWCKYIKEWTPGGKKAWSPKNYSSAWCRGHVSITQTALTPTFLHFHTSNSELYFFSSPPFFNSSRCSIQYQDLSKVHFHPALVAMSSREDRFHTPACAASTARWNHWSDKGTGQRGPRFTCMARSYTWFYWLNIICNLKSVHPTKAEG